MSEQRIPQRAVYNGLLDDIQLFSAILVVVFLYLARADYCIAFIELLFALSATTILFYRNNAANTGQAIRADNNFRNHEVHAKASDLT
jgi:uncharacterized membrane protein